MAWVVDTSVLLDIRIGTPAERATAAADCLQSLANQGIVVCPITVIEMAPAFHGDLEAERAWFASLNIASREPWLEEDTEAGHILWAEHIRRKRENLAPKRPIADILIAAFASRFQGLITRNEADFKKISPNLQLEIP